MSLFPKLNLIFLTIFVFYTTSYSQTSLKPWEIKVGGNFVNIDSDNVKSDLSIGGPSLSISRLLFGNFSFGGQISMNNIKGESFPSDLAYYSLDGFLKYTISTSGSIKPYIFGGYGFSSFDDGADNKKGPFPSFDVSETPFGGLGFDISLSEKFSIDLSSSYRYADELKSYKHFQHVVGLSFKPGTNDSDGDKIKDKKDECPDTPGLKEFAGCPDTDGDGIIDKNDKCPKKAGPSEMNGCPDSDGDQISDNNDECPNNAGPLELNGCPDSDGDSIIDKNDECPEEKGFPETNGCPNKDSDGDGVMDTDDKCPEIVGSIQNEGCPEVSSEIIEVLNTYGSSINFAASSDRILGIKTINILKQIKKLLDEYPKGKLIIEGHTSSDGDDEYNLKLSQKRAEAVVKYLISLGVNKSRLEAVGKGETKPRYDNNSPIGRAKNRRVEFKTSF